MKCSCCGGNGRIIAIETPSYIHIARCKNCNGKGRVYANKN